MGTGQRLVSDQALEACGVQEFHPAPIKQICWHLFVLRSWPGNSTARQAELLWRCRAIDESFCDLHMLIGEDAAPVVTGLRALLLQ